MTLPTLPPFGGEQSAEEFIRNYVSQETWTSQSGAEILRQLRDVGIPIRTTSFYELRREALSIVTHQEQIQALRPGSLIPEAWVTQARQWELEQNYLYQLEVVGETISSENVEIRHYSFYANERLTSEEISDHILGLIGEHAREYDFTVHDAQIVRVIGREERFD